MTSCWFLYFSYHNDARSDKHQIQCCLFSSGYYMRLTVKVNCFLIFYNFFFQYFFYSNLFIKLWKCCPHSCSIHVLFLFISRLVSSKLSRVCYCTTSLPDLWHFTLAGHVNFSGCGYVYAVTIKCVVIGLTTEICTFPLEQLLYRLYQLREEPPPDHDV